MKKIDTYMEFINEEFFKKIFNKNKSLKKPKLEDILFNILEFLKENGVDNWNDFLKMSQFDRNVVDKIIDHEVKGMKDLKEIRFLLKLELSDTQQLREYLKELEEEEDYEKCAKVLKKISKR